MKSIPILLSLAVSVFLIGCGAVDDSSDDMKTTAGALTTTAAASASAPSESIQLTPALSFYLTANTPRDVRLRVTDPNGTVVDVFHPLASTNQYEWLRCDFGNPQWEHIWWMPGLHIAGRYLVEVFIGPPDCASGFVGPYDLIVSEDGIEKLTVSGDASDPEIAPTIIKRFTYDYRIPARPALDDWQDLIGFRPPLSIQRDLESRGMEVQHVEDSDSSLNTDDIRLRIKLLPLDPGTGVRFTEAGFFSYLRTHLQDFAPAFQPYSRADRADWITNPLGSVWRIKLETFFGIPIFAEWGDVVTSHYSNISGSRRWRFTTLTTSADGSHPVTGTREFGLERDVSGFTFYTRGTDRNNRGGLPWGSDDNVYAKGEEFWRTFMAQLEKFVDTGGGIVGDIDVMRLKTDWFDACYYHWFPSQPWLDDPILRRYELCQP